MVAVPTASDLKARYPEFTGVADATAGLFIEEALGMVDDSWVETDQKPALLAYAAHLLSLEGYPARLDPTTALPTGAGREVVSRSVGDVSVQYAQTASGSSGSGLLASLHLSPYGRRFAQLLKLNAPAIGLV